MTRHDRRFGLDLTGGFVALIVFSFVINILLLIQPIYLLQIYDRVLSSASVETLAFISVIAVAALVLLGAVDAIRSMICGRIAARLEAGTGARALVGAMRGPRASLGDVQPLRDLATVRAFISGRALLAYFDLPFVPLFIGILYFIHPDLFWLTLGGATVLALLAWANQHAMQRPVGEAGERAMAAMLAAQSFARGAESIAAMGMVGNVVGAWGGQEARSLEAQDRLNRINAIYAGVSRMLRIGLQIAILGYGGYLVLAGEMTAGMIFASSLISGRGLQPIDQVIAGWKPAVDARKAWGRLSVLFAALGTRPDATDLPDPVGRLSLENVVVFPPNAVNADPLLKRISAEIPAGDCVVVIGPSGAGKSTLMRAIVGGFEIRSGAIRVDGADIRNWDRESLGRHVGYLAQDVELLPGTIAQNIARFDPDARDAAIIDAAKKAEVHDLIQRLPKGYDTIIGPAGQQLSGGQRQRVGLARAFYGSPKLLVLDEPNANLDTEGEMALDKALASAREAKVTVLLVTQRRPIAERADKIMILREGAVQDFGPRQEVFARQVQKAKAAQEAARAASNDRAEASPAQFPIVTGRFPAVFTGGRNSETADS